MEKIEIKCYKSSEFGRVPAKATKDSAGYDLFASHAKTILPGKSEKISLDLHWAIPTGFCGRIIGRSSLVLIDSVTVEGGLIDSDFRGIVQAILFNHSQKAFTVKEGERIAQVVFIRKFDAEFREVDSLEKLGKTERQQGGFGSTGKTVIKKLKLDRESDEDITISCDEGLTVICEEGIIKKDNEILLHEKVAS